MLAVIPPSLKIRRVKAVMLLAYPLCLRKLRHLPQNQGETGVGV